MAQHVCPWWGGYFIDNRLRHLLHNPDVILSPYVREGMTTMDFGCGMGFMSIAMARMVGEGGNVYSIDLQSEMLRTVRKRADKTELGKRIYTHQCEKDTVNFKQAVDFIIAFYSVHEVPDQQRLFTEFDQCLKHNGNMLLVEPRGHVSKDQFDATINVAKEIGWEQIDTPPVRLSYTAAFIKKGGAQ